MSALPPVEIELIAAIERQPRGAIGAALHRLTEGISRDRLLAATTQPPASARTVTPRSR